MKNLLKIIATLVVGLLVFTACEDDSTLNVPASTEIDLGEEFNPLDGVTVDDGDLEDVDYTWTDSLDNTIVGEYVITYDLNGTTMSRSVFVTAAALAGTYVVVDEQPGFTSDEYDVNVIKANAYNELRLSGWLYTEYDGLLNAVVDGEVITIPSQDITAEGSNINIQGTGSYNGATQKIIEIEYTIVEDDDDPVSGTSDFTN